MHSPFVTEQVELGPPGCRARNPAYLSSGSIERAAAMLVVAAQVELGPPECRVGNPAYSLDEQRSGVSLSAG